jgi:hypothetical protein
MNHHSLCKLGGLSRTILVLKIYLDTLEVAPSVPKTLPLRKTVGRRLKHDESSPIVIINVLRLYLFE